MSFIQQNRAEMFEMKQLWVFFNEFGQQVHTLNNITRIQAEFCVLPGRNCIHKGARVTELSTCRIENPP